MHRSKTKGSKALWLTAVPAAAGLLWIAASALGQGSGYVPSTAKGDWPYYTADEKGTKYSPLDQINASNFNKLEPAWRFKTDNLGTRPEYKLEGTPLAINGVLYTTAGTRRSVISLDGKTGELIWAHSMREGKRAAIAPRQLSGRGVAFWTDGHGDDRVVYVTTGYRLVELNAKTGQVISSFGNDGIVDLKVGMVTGTGQQIDLENGEAGLHSTPLVVKDVVIVGSSFKEGMTVVTHNNTKGLVRAYDVHTGKLLWTFNTIPRRGEFGYDTWENGSADTNGNTGVWTQMTVDEDAGLVYLPVESPTSDYYGGERPGDNLYGESLVCVDLITGKPVWPIEERAVAQSDVPGEKTAKTQPFPTKPPRYARNFIDVPNDLIDFTPEMRAQAKDLISRYRVEGMFTPPVVGDPNGKWLAGLNLGNASGGTNWPGAGVDPVTHIVYAQANQSAVTPISLRVPPQGFSDIHYVSGRNDQPFRVAEGPGFGSAADAPQPKRAPTPPPAAAAAGRGGRGAQGGGGGGFGLQVEGLSIVKPPYGVISAINLDKGDIQWQVPYGETADNVRDILDRKGIKYGNLGQGGSVGLLITKTLVVLGDTLVTSKTHPRGAMLRAYDKQTGKEVGAVWMPAPQSGSPMTYMAGGKQYIVVAVSGGNYSGEYIAYALPESD